MKKIKKEQSVETGEAADEKKVAAGAESDLQGAPNPEYPQEYEEDRSMDIRMIPQPLNKKEKE